MEAFSIPFTLVALKIEFHVTLNSGLVDLSGPYSLPSKRVFYAKKPEKLPYTLRFTLM